MKKLIKYIFLFLILPITSYADTNVIGLTPDDTNQLLNSFYLASHNLDWMTKAGFKGIWYVIAVCGLIYEIWVLKKEELPSEEKTFRLITIIIVFLLLTIAPFMFFFNKRTKLSDINPELIKSARELQNGNVAENLVGDPFLYTNIDKQKVNFPSAALLFYSVTSEIQRYLIQNINKSYISDPGMLSSIMSFKNNAIINDTAYGRVLNDYVTFCFAKVFQYKDQNNLDPSMFIRTLPNGKIYYDIMDKRIIDEFRIKREVLRFNGTSPVLGFYMFGSGPSMNFEIDYLDKYTVMDKNNFYPGINNEGGNKLQQEQPPNRTCIAAADSLTKFTAMMLFSPNSIGYNEDYVVEARNLIDNAGAHTSNLHGDTLLSNFAKFIITTTNMLSLSTITPDEIYEPLNPWDNKYVRMTAEMAINKTYSMTNKTGTSDIAGILSVGHGIVAKMEQKMALYSMPQKNHKLYTVILGLWIAYGFPIAVLFWAIPRIGIYKMSLWFTGLVTILMFPVIDAYIGSRILQEVSRETQKSITQHKDLSHEDNIKFALYALGELPAAKQEVYIEIYGWSPYFAGAVVGLSIMGLFGIMGNVSKTGASKVVSRVAGAAARVASR